MERSTALLLSAAAPIAVGGIGAGLAYLGQKKEENRRQENLRASARQVLNAGNFGKDLPEAQRKFTQLAATAPHAMQLPSVALPLVRKSIALDNDAESIMYATNLEKNLHTLKNLRREDARVVGKAFTLGSQVGLSMTPLFDKVVDKEFPEVPVPTSGGSGQGSPSAEAIEHAVKNVKTFEPRQMAIMSLLSKGVKIHDMNDEDLGNALTNEAHRLSNLGMDDWKKEMGQISGNVSKTYYHAHHEKTSSLSPESTGNALGLQYSLIKAACDHQKLSYDIKETVLNTLIGTGIAGAATGIGMGTMALYDKYKQNKKRDELQGVFSSVMKRLETNPGPFIAARNRLEANPVETRQIAREAFDVLAKTAPEMASHPLMLRNFLGNVIENEGEIRPEQLHNYAKVEEINQGINRARTDIVPFTRAFTAFGGTAAMSSGLDQLIRAPHMEARDQAARTHDLARQQVEIASREKAQKAQEESMKARDSAMHNRAKELQNLRHKDSVKIERMRNRHDNQQDIATGHMTTVGDYY